MSSLSMAIDQNPSISPTASSSSSNPQAPLIPIPPSLERFSAELSLLHHQFSSPSPPSPPHNHHSSQLEPHPSSSLPELGAAICHHSGAIPSHSLSESTSPASSALSRARSSTVGAKLTTTTTTTATTTESSQAISKNNPTSQHHHHPSYSSPVLEAVVQPPSSVVTPIDTTSEPITKNSPTPILTSTGTTSTKPTLINIPSSPTLTQPPSCHTQFHHHHLHHTEPLQIITASTSASASSSSTSTPNKNNLVDHLPQPQQDPITQSDFKPITSPTKNHHKSLSRRFSLSSAGSKNFLPFSLLRSSQQNAAVSPEPTAGGTTHSQRSSISSFKKRLSLFTSAAPIHSPPTPLSTSTPTNQNKMHHHTSLSPSITQLNLIGHHTEPIDISSDPFHASSVALQSPNRSASLIKPHRHSFWSGLGSKDRSNSRKNSSVTLATYPNQRIYKTCTLDSMTRRPSLLGPSRVIAVVGNIRRGIGRMIVEELVSQKFIVVALVDKADGEFSRSVELLASSPSLFHAFVVEGGLFGQAMAGETEELGKVNNNNNNDDQLVTEPRTRTTRAKSFRSFRLGSKKSYSSKGGTPLSSATGSLGDSSITEISSHGSFMSTPPSTTDTARVRTIVELKNIFQAYRVDTVICSFEPQVLDQPAGPRSKARMEDERQFGLPPVAERARIERMERTVLEASLASSAVGRFSVTIHPTSLGPCVLSPNPSNSIRPHLLSALSEEGQISHDPPISITEFRWGFLMNDLAFDDSLVDGQTAENGLGKWLCEPSRSRSVIDLEHLRCLIPAKTTRRESSKKKGKHKLEPVCMTLAEDVARFIGLACRLRDHWEWKSGKMVGDCVPGGWEQIVETIERTSRKQLDRQYVCVGSMMNGYASDSGSSNSSLEQQKQMSNADLADTSGMVQGCRLSSEEVYRFDDELRGTLAKDKHDASAVRLSEFIRVWYTPLPQPPSIVIDGNRCRKKSFRGNFKKNSSSPFKPQVAENGTLREVGLKPNNNHNRRKADEAPNQFLSVPSSAKQTNNLSVGQALSTNSSRPVPASQVQLSQSKTTDFNFIPKAIVPFNNPLNSANENNFPRQPGMTQQQQKPVTQNRSFVPSSTPNGQSYPTMTFQEPYQPPKQPSYSSLVTPFNGSNHNNTRPPPPPPSQGGFSLLNHQQKQQQARHIGSGFNTNNPNVNHSVVSNNNHHDSNRILPRSPLAARVA
ncbi:hypothetical protein Pst134EA_015055 [Puccinia striiformis f. sp. tritici]|uniref:hypothetical protein n=1 Tax=Puccinia striiformis f. sp. tritici TaxID=168172 RepID=UPI002007D049|nr:hypothetical protein Pst134EA_015055 [Puccinia striiformis f. sp. tritici]KAH9462967.1 hypothetical protein Pst134EA_015055 [Puccinia striiformis f. sp. tritici]